MALRTNLFFLLLFLFAAFFAILIDTDSNSLKKSVDIPAIEFKDFEIYKITPLGVTESAVAKKGLHYSNRDILYNAFLYQDKNGNIEGISGDFIEITPKEAVVKGNGKFMSSLGYELESENIFYDKVKSLIKTPGEFTIREDRDTIRGKELHLNIETKFIQAKDIVAKIDMEKVKG